MNNSSPADREVVEIVMLELLVSPLSKMQVPLVAVRAHATPDAVAKSPDRRLVLFVTPCLPI